MVFQDHTRQNTGHFQHQSPISELPRSCLINGHMNVVSNALVYTNMSYFRLQWFLVRKPGLEVRKKKYQYAPITLPSPNTLEGLGEHCKLPQRGPGQSPHCKSMYVIFWAQKTRLVATKLFLFMVVVRKQCRYAILADTVPLPALHKTVNANLTGLINSPSA